MNSYNVNNPTHVKILQRWTKRQANKMMTRRVEEVPTVRWIDIEENTRNNDGLFLQQFLKEGLLGRRYCLVNDASVSQRVGIPGHC